MSSTPDVITPPVPPPEPDVRTPPAPASPDVQPDIDPKPDDVRGDRQPRPAPDDNGEHPQASPAPVDVPPDVLEPDGGRAGPAPVAPPIAV